ncbi:DUF3606 domain-containing protein [Piscinibacter koreensis]|uniref:DUF3606 domain-containing protein n=1 Tax=Piscinibacter koreensis TaxID=2742824 RepID=A0A7Y6NKJ2_9BURK|nr:DUF3606 domain-containing protein [Schlegelella koreensis]NUZ04799.1 DUF3606 domain-containing protein [Schlegelella koreensis]
MPDNKQHTGGQDRQRINVHEDYELRDWAKKFNATPEQIKEAVQAVGDLAADVEMHLNGTRSTTNKERVASAGG